MSNLPSKPNFAQEIWHYVKKYKRWWLLPIIAVFLIFAVLVGIAEVAPVVSPFIYTLF
jgi:hypothetical protein